MLPLPSLKSVGALAVLGTLGASLNAGPALAQAPGRLIEEACRLPMPVNYVLSDLEGLVAYADCFDVAKQFQDPKPVSRVWVVPTKVEVAYGVDGKPGVIFNPVREPSGRYGMVIDLLLEAKVDDYSLSKVKTAYPEARIQYLQGVSSVFELKASNGFLLDDADLENALLVQGLPQNVRISLDSTGLNALRCTLDELDAARNEDASIDGTFNAINILTGKLALSHRLLNNAMDPMYYSVESVALASPLPVMPQRNDADPDKNRRDIVLDQFARNVRHFAPACDARLNASPAAQLPAYAQIRARRTSR